MESAWGQVAFLEDPGSGGQRYCLRVWEVGFVISAGAITLVNTLKGRSYKYSRSFRILWISDSKRFDFASWDEVLQAPLI
jgi:hypothetical protein